MCTVTVLYLHAIYITYIIYLIISPSCLSVRPYVLSIRYQSYHLLEILLIDNRLSLQFIYNSDFHPDSKYFKINLRKTNG